MILIEMEEYRFIYCDDKAIKYYEWEAAVRGYNGYGCLLSTKDYVEQVMSRYQELNDLSTEKSAFDTGLGAGA